MKTKTEHFEDLLRHRTLFQLSLAKNCLILGSLDNLKNPFFAHLILLFVLANIDHVDNEIAKHLIFRFCCGQSDL